MIVPMQESHYPSLFRPAEAILTWQPFSGVGPDCTHDSFGRHAVARQPFRMEIYNIVQRGPCFPFLFRLLLEEEKSSPLS